MGPGGHNWERQAERQSVAAGLGCAPTDMSNERALGQTHALQLGPERVCATATPVPGTAWHGRRRRCGSVTIPRFSPTDLWACLRAEQSEGQLWDDKARRAGGSADM